MSNNIDTLFFQTAKRLAKNPDAAPSHLPESIKDAMKFFQALEAAGTYNTHSDLYQSKGAALTEERYGTTAHALGLAKLLDLSGGKYTISSPSDLDLLAKHPVLRRVIRQITIKGNFSATPELTLKGSFHALKSVEIQATTGLTSLEIPEITDLKLDGPLLGQLILPKAKQLSLKTPEGNYQQLTLPLTEPAYINTTHGLIQVTVPNPDAPGELRLTAIEEVN